MKKGFSLIELSVVIVIIGLLVGVLVAARSIRNTAQIQATISDLGKYKQAAIQYKEKYYYWPGDDLNAGNVWHEVSTNGNGNNIIGDTALEIFLVPQELSLAGFITGSYKGQLANYTPGIGFPKSPIDFINVTSTSTMGGGVIHPIGGNDNPVVPRQSTLNSSIYIFEYNSADFGNGPINKNSIEVSDVDNIDGAKQEGAISPDNAYAIDQKIDDGKLSSGYIVGLDSDETICGNSNGDYDIGNNTAACIVSFSME